MATSWLQSTVRRVHVRGAGRWSRWVLTTLVAMGALAGIFGCSSGSPPPHPPQAPADLLLHPDQLPKAFAPTQLSVADLVADNGSNIEAAGSSRVTPPECRPTADATLNPQLNATNSAVLAARSTNASLVQLVSTVRRDVDADIRTTTGACTTTTTVIGGGNLSGSTVVTRHGQLDTASIDHENGVEQSLAVRSDSITTLRDGGAIAQTGYAGYAVVDRPGAPAVTVQLTVSGDSSAAARPAPPAVAPMTDAEFTALFAKAIAASSV